MIYRATAHLSAPVLSRTNIHLDGILVWSASMDLGFTPLMRSTDLSDVPDVPIPIPFISFQGCRVPLCSAWHLPEIGRHQHSFIRRRDVVDIESRRRTFVRGYGPGRDLLKKRSALLVGKIHWIFATTDPDKVEQLLNRVHCIGALRAHGCGNVVRWKLEKVEGETFHVLVDRNGYAARNLPISWINGSSPATRQLPYAPPYWHMGMLVEAVAPGTPVQLRQEVLDLLGTIS